MIKNVLCLFSQQQTTKIKMHFFNKGLRYDSNSVLFLLKNMYFKKRRRNNVLYTKTIYRMIGDTYE